VLKTVYHSGCRDKHNCQRRDSNLDPLTPQSDAITTRPPILIFHCCLVIVHTRFLCAFYNEWMNEPIDQLWTKFVMMTHIGPLQSTSLKFRVFKNPRWRRPPSWKSQKSLYVSHSDRSSRNLSRWCIWSLLHRQTVNNSQFLKFQMPAG